MQVDEALELQKNWEKRGNPHCDHERIAKEYYLGTQTGDFVCTTCGECHNSRKVFKK